MQLHVNEYGSDGGTPLLILHGFMGTADNWHTLAQQFSTNRKVLTADLRNHGRSPHSDDFSIALMASDVLELMEQHHLSTVNLLGHSMGGKVAMYLALHYPEKIDKLLVADIAPRPYHRGHDDIFEALFAVDLPTITSRKQAEEAMLPYIPDFGVRQFLMKNLSRTEDGQFYWKMNLSVLHRKYEEIIIQIEHAVPFSKPALFIRGARSNYIRDKDIPEIVRLFPNSRVVTIPQAGHWVHAEQPRAFFDAVEAFLAE
jgi:pimeloyl-ACP methyl ester carboxylesterase